MEVTNLQLNTTQLPITCAIGAGSLHAGEMYAGSAWRLESRLLFSCQSTQRNAAMRCSRTDGSRAMQKTAARSVEKWFSLRCPLPPGANVRDATASMIGCRDRGLAKLSFGVIRLAKQFSRMLLLYLQRSLATEKRRCRFHPASSALSPLPPGPGHSLVAILGRAWARTLAPFPALRGFEQRRQTDAAVNGERGGGGGGGGGPRWPSPPVVVERRLVETIQTASIRSPETPSFSGCIAIISAISAEYYAVWLHWSPNSVKTLRGETHDRVPDKRPKSFLTRSLLD